jgi:mRNA-degrading endonuclease RelE of RelBE toxin-antitoxin system
MNILIESSKDFERDLKQLTGNEKDIVITKINECAQRFELQESNAYHKLRRIHSLLNLVDRNSSSLYVLKISHDLRVILSVDDDPVFEQTIITLFRVVKRSDLEKAYKGIAESLYHGYINTTSELAA